MNATLEKRLDSWENATTGVGGARDKSSLFYFVPGGISSDSYTLECMYDQDHLAGKIVDAIPDQVFLRGWEVTSSDASAREKIIDACDRLELEKHVDQALRWEGLHGGSAILIGADDGLSVTSPLDMKAIKAVHFINTFDRWELTPHSFYDAALHPKFGQPKTYRVCPRVASANGVGMIVHESRLVLFHGRTTTKTQLVANQYWGQSRLLRAYTAIKHYGASLASVLALMADASQGVYKIRGLFDMIRAGNADELKFRMAAMDQVRGIVNAIVMDAEGEDYQRIATPLTELANLVDRFKIDVCSAAETPATVLFGQAPAGLNATGESDMRNWYDKIAQCQRRRVIPAMEQILRCVLRSAHGPTRGLEPEKWAVTFPSPWQPTSKEEAEIRKINADADAIYVDLQVLTPHQIARARMSGETAKTEILLTEDEIEALNGTADTMALKSGSLALNEGGAEPDDALALDGQALVTGPTQAIVAARSFAAAMTENGFDRCQHDKTNRCQICQIERVRSVERGPKGEPIFGVRWVAIADAAAEAAEVAEADAEQATTGDSPATAS